MNPHLLCLTSCALADWLFTTELPGKTLPAGKENLDDLGSGEGTPPPRAISASSLCLDRDVDLQGRSREDGREESPHSLPGKSHGASFRNNKIITWETVEDFKGQTFSPSKVYTMSATDPSGTFF